MSVQEEQLIQEVERFTERSDEQLWDGDKRMTVWEKGLLSMTE